MNALLNYPGAKWGMAEEIDKAYFELQEKAFEEYTSQMRIDGI